MLDRVGAYWDMRRDKPSVKPVEYFQENNRRRPRLIRSRMNYLEIFDEIHFKERFVISKDNFLMLLEKIQGQIRHSNNRNNAIPSAIQLMVTLRFYTIGSFLQTTGDFWNY